MKKLIYILLLFPVFIFGQTTGQNYVRTYNYKESTTTSDATKANATVTYYDGLGRPIQQISGKISGNGKDVIKPIQYDAFGRQTKDYLPYEAATTDLSFDGSAESNVLTFYNTSSFESTTNPYGENFLEASPLNRVLKKASPGNLWQGHLADDNDRTIKYAYLANASSTGAVRKLRAVAQNPINGVYNTSIVDDGSYSENQLYRTLTQDENSSFAIQTGSGFKSSTEEYKDTAGRVILKKSYVSTSDNFGMPGQVFPLVYYIYDQYGNLSYVIPGNMDIDISQDNIDKYGYQYKYDVRNRLVEKKMPGKAWEYIVYDNLDRIVAKGPAYSPFGSTGNTQKGWLISKYDPFGRIAYTGWVAATDFSSAGRNTLQGNNFVSETKTTTGTSVDNISIYYTNVGYPTTGLKLLNVYYYDNYTFPSSATFPSSGVEGETVISNAKGLLTGTLNRILTISSETFVENTTTFYDSKARPLRVRTTNSQLGGYTQTDTKLDFDGTLLYKIIKQKRTNSSADAEIVVRNDYSYTAQDRLLSETHTIGALPAELMSYNLYNSIGQLKEKKVGRTQTSPLQDVDFTYNIRGWLTAINNVSNLASLGNPQDLFAFKINYTDNSQFANVSPKFNGNISETSWRTSTDNIMRRYSYKYDELNRLRDSYYQIPGAVVPMRNSYDESLKYDSYGNIIKLKRNGGVDDENTPVEIDNLTYTYVGNRLDRVVDSSNSPQGFNDQTATTVNDFGYDNFGNLTSDLNKGISVNGIIYNHMNLPVKITMNSPSGIGTISYIYNAYGVRLKKTVLNTGVTPNTTTDIDYLNGFQYKNSILDFIPTSEGYVKNTVVNNSNVYNYVYNYTDHLGNIRVSYTLDPADGNLKILEENHYYPFGLKHTGYNSVQNMIIERATFPRTTLTPVTNPADMTYKYKFNSKELQNELGLNTYDFGARNYDPALGRWMNIDPLAEKSVAFSPYNFANNNPVVFVDPDGMAAVGADGLTSEQWMEASRIGADPNLGKMYRAYNNSELGTLNNEIETAFGDKADDRIANPSADVVRSVINKIPILKRHFNRLQKSGKFDIKYSDKPYDQGGGEAITNNLEMDKDLNWNLQSKIVDTYILFYGSSFRSFRNLAHNILHEFGHVESMNTGFFQKNINFFQSVGYSAEDSRNFAVSVDEVFAYNWAFEQGSLHPSIQMGYEIRGGAIEYHYNFSYAKAINKLETFANMYYWQFNSFYAKSR